jgi:phospholipid/cholesterol/gamma-HCH transport system substrate-binding protein
MKDSLETKLGMFFALAIIITLVILESLGGFAFFKRGKHLHAQFRNVQDLRIGDPVKMAGVTIGKVASIALTDTMAEVTMNVNRDAAVKIDSKASIGFTGLMGSYFVTIDFGTATGPLAENDAVLQTVEKPDLSALMARLDSVATGIENLTKSFSGEKIDSLLGPLTDFVKNNQANLSASIGNLRKVSDEIAQGKGTVGRLIHEDTLYVSTLNTINNVQKNMENTAGDLRKTTEDARGLMANANKVIDSVNSGQGTIGKLLKDDTLYRASTGSMTNLHQILQKINQGQGSVGKLVNDDSLIKDLKLSMQKLDKATESLEDTGPLSVLGTMVTVFF